MNPLIGLFDDLLSLFYPRLCMACEQQSPAGDELFCIRCQYKLPRTDFHLDAENEFTRRFWGRLRLETGASLYRFVKGGRAQSVVHQIKYNNQKELGVWLGERYGKILLDSPIFRTVEVIVPVPLHPKKEHRRGYNQSDLFARGLSKGMHIPWVKRALKRTRYTESQTRKTKIERLENVMGVFVPDQKHYMEGKHVLLVDDVLTSGATLEACGAQILGLKNTKLSLATIAIADL